MSNGTQFAQKKPKAGSFAQTAFLMEPQGGDINMKNADFNMYFYFTGEASKGTQLAQTAQGGAIGAAKEAL